MAPKRLPPAAYLRQCFDYDPSTGVLTWKRRPREHFPTTGGWRSFTTKQAGKVAGSLKTEGYIVVCINGQLYKAHRIIWKMQTGREPPIEIDHRNRDKADNRWHKIREATRQQNRWNSKRQSNRALPKGVYYRPNLGRYAVQITIDKKLTYLGLFDTPTEAARAVRDYVKSHRGEFYRSG